MERQTDTEPDWDAIEQEFMAGTSWLKDIAAKHGVTMTAILRRLSIKQLAAGGEEVES